MNGDRRLQINHLVNGNGGGGGGGGDNSGINTTQRPEALVNGNHINGAPPEVYRFVENDRTYYAYRNSCVYAFPCDEDEAERLDMLHTVIVDVALSKRLVTDESILGGPSRPQVLDVGYGTGIWAYEMALQYPNVDVVGIDLYNNQPERDDEAVANASFLTPVDFTQSDWGFREGTFDLIHMSQLCGCVPDWAQHYARVLRYLKPESGWVEHVEIDWKPRYDDEQGKPMPAELEPLQRWWNCMVEASTRLRGSIAYREDTDRLLNRAGFRDIGHKVIRIPLGGKLADSRDAKLSRWFKFIMCGDQKMRPTFETLSTSLLTRQLGWKHAQVAHLCRDARVAYSGNEGPLYHDIHIWTARKPKS